MFGWNCGAFGTILSGVRELSTVLTSTTRQVPDGVEAGDLIVGVICTISSVQAYPTPSGYTNLDIWNGANWPWSHASQAAQIAVIAKIADGDESEDFLPPHDTGGEGEGGGFGGVMVFRFNQALVSKSSAKSKTSVQTSGNPSARTVTAGSGLVPNISFGLWGSTGDVTDSNSMTPSKNGQIALDTNRFAMAWKVQFSDPVNVSLDLDDEGSANKITGFYLEVA